MEFKKEELVEREIAIGQYLLQGFSFKLISKKTGLSKKHIQAHIHNMMEKLNAKDRGELLTLLKAGIVENKKT